MIPTTSPQAAATTRLAEDLRTDVLAEQKEPTFLAGTTAGYVDFTNKVSQRMPCSSAGSSYCRSSS